MSTHLFPAHMRCRNEHDNPESLLTVAGAILAALVIIIALAVAVAVASGAVVWNFKMTRPTPPGIAMPERLDTRLAMLHLFDGFPDKPSTEKLGGVATSVPLLTT